MTIKTLLEKAKAADNWQITVDGKIRTSGGSCPISAALGCGNSGAIDACINAGVPERDAHEIISSADNDNLYPKTYRAEMESWCK
jgi:hypothetical protein